MSNSTSGPTSATTKSTNTVVGKPTEAEAKLPQTMFVFDTTATPLDATKEGSGPRTHQMLVNKIVKPFVFHHDKPTELPTAVALKFLKHEAFRLTDKDGNITEFQRRPKQPHELQAGERFKPREDETIAKFSELTTFALMHRCIETKDGEQFEGKNDRDGMVAFLVEQARERIRKTPVLTDDAGIALEDGYIPEFDASDEAA